MNGISTLRTRFATFPAFWSHFKEGLANDYRPKGRINAIFLAKSAYNYFRNWPFWTDEEDAIESFMTLLALICAEIQQRDIIQAKIYSQIEDFMVTITKTRRVVKSSEIGNRKIINYEEPLLEIPDLTQQVFGFHNRADWTKSTRREITPEVQTSEGIITTDQDGKRVISPNWTSVENDPTAMSRLLNSFPEVEINFKTFLTRFQKAGIFLPFYSPEGEFVWDSETKQKVWKTRSQIIEEQIEEEGGILPITENIEDDISEKEYLKLKLLDPNKVAKSWQLERLNRRKKYLEKQVKTTAGGMKEKWMQRLIACNELIEAFEKNVEMPKVGLPTEKLSTNATHEEWEQASFWARINRTVGYQKFKSALADFVDIYNDLTADKIDIPAQMFLLVGQPGVGKTHIAEAFADATDRPIETISMNGKKDTSIFFGVPQEYLGSGLGEIIKAITRFKDKSMVLVFDELDKCDKQVQQVLGNITDRKLNKKFKDVFFDYPVAINELIIFVTANYPEDLEPFIYSRLTPVIVDPQSYNERIEIANDYLDFQFHKYKIDQLRNKMAEALIKKFLTWEWGVRGLIDNIEKFSSKVYLLNKRNNLPDNWETYQEWPVTQKVELDFGDLRRNRPACPVSVNLKANHLTTCECFKPHLIEGWIAKMGSDYPQQ